MDTLVNPWEQVVVFGKAYSTNSVLHGSNVRVLRSLVPTGGHVGTANNLTHVKGPRSGGPATNLEHYTKGKVSKGRLEGVLEGGRWVVKHPGEGVRVRTASDRKAAGNFERAFDTVKSPQQRRLDAMRQEMYGKAAAYSNVGRAILRSRGMSPPKTAERAAMALKKVKPISFTDVGSVGRRQTG